MVDGEGGEVRGGRLHSQEERGREGGKRGGRDKGREEERGREG